MKSAKLWIMLLVISFFIAGCTDKPGPLANNMSRIQVICMGLDSLDIEIVDASTDNRVGDLQQISCVLYSEFNYDVPVPPYVYKVRQIDDNDNRILLDTVTFNAAGETQTVRIEIFNKNKTEPVEI